MAIGRRRHDRLGLALATLLVGAVPAVGQELDPGAYTVAPINLNVFVAATTLSRGDIAFDPALPIDDATATMNVTALVYGRTFGLFGRSANASLAVPIVKGHINGLYLGEFAEADRFGLGDPRVRLGFNVHGAPAMDRKTFAANRPRRLVGASLTVSMPLGQYSTDRLINIGGHRWAFKPELGMVAERGRWQLETSGGAWLFGTNSDFYRNGTRSQKPIFSLQFHLQYATAWKWLISGNSNFYMGGRTTVNGRQNLDLQRNSRVGVTFSRPMSGGRTLRAAVSQGALTTVGAAFTSLSVAFQQVWGGS